MKRVLVLRLSALGDVIHTIPAVITLRDCNVSWVVEAPYRELVELVTGVHAIPVRYRKWGKSLYASRGDIATAVRAMQGTSESIDFQGLVKSAVLGVLARAKTRTGFDRDAIREKPALLFTNRKVPVDTTRHVLEQNLQLVSAVTESQPLASGSLERQGNWDAFPLNSGLDAFTNKIVFLPGAGKANKLWPTERFRELARRIGSDVIAVWGPGERELAEEIGVPLAPPTNLRELAFILQQAKVVIGGDTGPLHLATALGTKVVGLYGPTDPRRNGPYGQLDNCIDRFQTTKLMHSITVEEVMTILGRICA
ncbi:MAG TPA: glycosyltransferase family 9 protein [Thermoanaerobaculia bacterium]|jgi:lipopolysaccharide heptosyltransferase I